MDSEGSLESDNTSSNLQTANDSHLLQDSIEPSASESNQDLTENNGLVSKVDETSILKEMTKNEQSLMNGEDIVNGKHLEEKAEVVHKNDMELNNEDNDDDIVDSEQDNSEHDKKNSDEESNKFQETSMSSDEQEEHVSNGLESADDLKGSEKCVKDTNCISENIKDKENKKINSKSEGNYMQTRSFSVITKAKQSAKKSLGHNSNADKTEKEKSFVLSEVTDDDIEQIRDDSCFPDYLKPLLSVGRYIPVQIVNPRDYRPKNNEKLIEAPSLAVPLLIKERNIYFDKTYKYEKQKHFENSTQDNYFNSSVGRFLIGLGFSRVREWYHRDMTKVKERQLRKGANKDKSETLGNELQEHKSEYLQAKQANEPFVYPAKKCQLCPFQTESHLILEGHYLTPHISPRREFLCNFCSYNTRDAKMIMFHMEAIHNKRAVIDLPVFYECPFCLFETHLKTKFSGHLGKCQRTFRCSLNQAPPRDFPYPTLTPKPVTANDVKEYEANLSNMDSNLYAFKNSHKLMLSHASGSNRSVIPNMSSFYQQLASVDYQQLHQLSANNVQLLPTSGSVRTKYPIMNQLHGSQNKIPFPITSNHIYHFINTNGQLVPVMGKDLINSSSRLSFMSSAVESSLQQKKSQHGSYDTNSGSMTRVIKIDGKKNMVTLQSSDSKSSSTHLTPLQSSPVHGTKSASQSQKVVTSGGQTSKIVICEICDGYIKDLEQLQTHMHWIHKVKIHPKMLSSRPPLNCQKCQSRFFTDQGLERHLLGTHGLVTPNMQDMANKNQDGGCCTICRQFYACKLVAHISQVHKITLKPAHLSYKCTVCSATFSLYRQFENHVYSVHSGSGKRSVDSDSPQSNKKLATLPLDKNKSKLILEKNISTATKKEHNELTNKHSSIYVKEKQGKHTSQPVSIRLKKKKYLRRCDRGKET